MKLPAALAGALLAACVCMPASAQDVYGPPDDLLEQVPPVDEAAVAQKARQEREAANRKAILPGLIATELIHVADAVTTIRCGRPKVDCEEKWNPHLYGRKPTVGRTLAVKVPIMLLTYGVARLAEKADSPIPAYVFFAVSGGITGKAVVGNFRVVF